MGMFDTVMVPCPYCGTKNGFQTKSGDCLLKYYDLRDCPEDVLIDVNRHPGYCEQCEMTYKVDIKNRRSVYA